MCGGILGGGSSAPPPQTLVSAPAATNVAQNAEDKTSAALKQEKKNALKYGASKTKTNTMSLGNTKSNVATKEALGG